MAESYSRRMVYTRIEETVHIRSSRVATSPPVITQRARRPQPPPADATLKADAPKATIETPSVPPLVNKSEVAAKPPPTLHREPKVISPAPKSLVTRPLPTAQAANGNVGAVQSAKMVSPVITPGNSNTECRSGCLVDLSRSNVAKFQTLVVTIDALSKAAVGRHVDGTPGEDGISIVSNASPGTLLSILQAVARSSEVHGKVKGYPPAPCSHKSRLILTEASESCTAYIVSVVPHHRYGVTFNFAPVEGANAGPTIRAGGVVTGNRAPGKCLSPVRIPAAIVETPFEAESDNAPESTAMVLRPAGAMQVGFAPLSSLKFN